jgi:hypothetical protein
MSRSSIPWGLGKSQEMDRIEHYRQLTKEGHSNLAIFTTLYIIYQTHFTLADISILSNFSFLEKQSKAKKKKKTNLKHIMQSICIK